MNNSLIMLDKQIKQDVYQYDESAIKIKVKNYVYLFDISQTRI